MPLSIEHVTVDCQDAGELAGFWSRLLDQPVDPDPSPFFATVGRSSGTRPALMFIQVPDRTPGKNSVHLDLLAPDWIEQVEWAVGLGAVHLADHDEYGTVWATLRDPEGNLFDIGRAR